jgi:hypothetical protein
LQQSAVTVQVSPVFWHVEAAAVQTPLVAPGAMGQESPVQQSEPAVQLALATPHAALQTPPTQLPEQQSPPVVQAVALSFATHDSKTHLPLAQARPLQQPQPFTAPGQVPPLGTQEVWLLVAQT